MDFGLIALVLVLAREVLNYVAPKTKTKADDTALEMVKKAEQLLPAAKTVADMRSKAEAASKPVEGFGMARDHR